MPVLFSYLLKVSVSLGLVYLFYRTVLQNLTFYSWNRWYLLGFSALSFFLPFINIAALIQPTQTTPARLITYVPALESYTTKPLPGTPLMPTTTESAALDTWQVLLFIFLTGIFILLVKIGMQLFSYLQFKKSAQLVLDGSIKVYQVNQRISPFSFGRAVFLNKTLHSDAELTEIIRHEFVHVKQGHTLDIIWGEVMCLLNWYNPFAWLLRQSLRQNLEFIADNQVILSGINKKQYQYLLLKITGTPEFRITNQFSFLSLKKRIAMMNKMPNTRAHLVKFLFVLPLLAVSLLAFRKPPVQKNEISMNINNLKVNIDSRLNQSGKIDDKNIVNIKPSEKQIVILTFKDGTQQKYDLATETGKQAYNNAQRLTVGGYSTKGPNRLPEDYKAFLTRNPQVKAVRWRFDRVTESSSPDLVILTLKSGAEEVYSLINKIETEAVENKYGKLPRPAPAPPRIDVVKFNQNNQQKTGAKSFVPPTITPDQLPADHKDFLARNPQVKTVGWQGNKLLVLFLKSGQQEKYNLNKDESKSQAVKKYGKLPKAPFPPPPARNKVSNLARENNDTSTIKNLRFVGTETAVFELKNGGEEKYNLKTRYDLQRFSNRYHEMRKPRPSLPENLILLYSNGITTWRVENSKPEVDYYITIGEKLIVSLKSGEQEIYYNNKQSRSIAEKKYGKLPFYSILNEEIHVPVILPENKLPADYKAFIARNPNIDSVGRRPDGVLVVLYKSGYLSELNLQAPDVKKLLEKKTGKLPSNLLPTKIY